MDWLRNLDVELFRFINGTLNNPFFDWLMPMVSQNPFSRPLRWFTVAAIAIVGALLLWKKRYRALLCMLMLGVGIGVGDGVVCNTIKHLVGRPRPFSVLPGVRKPGTQGMGYSAEMAVSGLGGMGNDADSKAAQTKGVAPANPMPATRGNSMPSAHAANCFAAAMVLFVFYRRTLWFMLPLAIVVAFSRVYNGVHYPSDVLAGAILGAGTAAALLWPVNRMLISLGCRGVYATPGGESGVDPRHDQSL